MDTDLLAAGASDAHGVLLMHLFARYYLLTNQTPEQVEHDLNGIMEGYESGARDRIPDSDRKFAAVQAGLAQLEWIAAGIKGAHRSAYRS